VGDLVFPAFPSDAFPAFPSDAFPGFPKNLIVRSASALAAFDVVVVDLAAFEAHLSLVR